jgi:primosomal protein N' (replication factor Y)
MAFILMRYAKVALDLPIQRLFDYLIPENYIPEYPVGARVLVSFSNRNLIGFVAELTSKTDIDGVKPITKFIDSRPVLNTDFLRLTKTAAGYYCSSWGQMIFSALPAGIRKGIPVNIEGGEGGTPKDKVDNPKISFYQGISFDKRFKMYSADIERALRDKKSVIILSPEIKLCMRIFDSLKQKYSNQKIAVTYRKQKMKEELHLWEKAKNGKLDILVGTRPCVFAPFQGLGLIILEEEDGYGYKEEQAPYYHARDVAAMRARIEGCAFILAGRAPTLESYYEIKNKRYQLVSPENAPKNKPEIKIVDMRQYGFSKGMANPAISAVLDDRIHKALALNKKIIIFANRKGFAHSVYCNGCQLVLQCDRCSSKLTFYREKKKLICNMCGFAKNMPLLCPQCKVRYIKYKGLGLERLKSQLHLSYPQAKICHIDKENQTMADGFQILIATEMLFHTDYMPQADIAAAIDLEEALNIVDFRGSEKLYSLTQRLRTISRDELIIQTRMPEYYRKKEFIDFDLYKLFDLELKERKTLRLPPFTHLAQINLRAKDLERVRKAASDIYETLINKDRFITVFEPSEAMPLKLRGNYRFKILLKAKDPFRLSKFLKENTQRAKSQKVITTIEMDPR